TSQYRSAGADGHVAFGRKALLRHRSAPARGPARRPRRDFADAAAGARDKRISGIRPYHAALDSLCRTIGMNTLSNMVKVAVVGGEGIGPEVTDQSHRILKWFAARRAVPVVLREAQYGLVPYLASGKVLPDDTVEAMEEADAILWGATGGPETTEV